MVAPRSLRLVESFKKVWAHSPWIVIAVTVHVTAAAVLSILTFREHRTVVEEKPFQIARGEDAAAPIVPPEEPPLDRQPVPKQDTKVELVPPDAIDLPVVDTPQDLSKNLGDDNGDSNVLDHSSSTTIGPGNKGGTRALNVSTTSTPGRGFPSRSKGRHPEATPKSTEEAVLQGMRWLVRHQKSDGSWSIPKLSDQCIGATPCVAKDQNYSAHYDEGLTALAVLAFLGAGYGHDAQAIVVDPIRARRYILGQDVVLPALRWLVDHEKPDGSFGADGPFMYNQALATMALCEAYGLTGARFWKMPAQKAVDFLVRAQKRSPIDQGPWGWRYAPREDVTTTGALDEASARAQFDSDTSVTTWAVMALKSAELAGLSVPRESLDGALNFVRWVSAKDGRAGYLDASGAGLAVGGVGEQFRYHIATMSALSMCTRIFTSHDPSDPFLESAAGWIVRDLPEISRDRLSVDYYYWYYGSLALNQLDGPDSPKHTGKYWTPWNKAMSSALLELQDRTQGACSNGAWLVPDRWSYTGGPLYATALNVLTLEVYYRYGNAFGSQPERKATTKERGR